MFCSRFGRCSAQNQRSTSFKASKSSLHERKLTDKVTLLVCLYQTLSYLRIKISTSIKITIRMNQRLTIFFTLLIVLIWPEWSQAQVYMRPFDNGATLAIGGAASARPDVEMGLVHPAQLGQGLRRRVGAQLWSVIPYGIVGWQSHGGQLLARINQNSGVGLTILHSGIEGYREQRADLAYGRRLGEKWTIGGSMSLLHVAADEYYGNRTTVTGTIGVQTRVLPTVWIAALVSNPAAQSFGDYKLPTILQLSASWIPTDKVLVISEIDKSLNGPTRIKGGIEYRPAGLLAIRAGMRSHPARATFGVGLRLKNGLAFDFGSEWHPTLGITPGIRVAI
jgi:hypothetical protein